MKAENILQGDYTQLTFVIGVLKILVKYIYALNDNMTNCHNDNYSNTFFKTVFENSMDLDYNVKITVGDFNVAPNHGMDTL